MSAKNSKFSGIFAQAREREGNNSPEESGEVEAQTSVQPVDESAQNQAQEPPRTAQTMGKSASKGPVAKSKTTAESPLKAEITPVEMAGEVTETASGAPRNGRPRGKRSDPNFIQITAYISKTTHQKMKLALLGEGQKREISELIEDPLAAWLAQKTEYNQIFKSLNIHFCGKESPSFLSSFKPYLEWNFGSYCVEKAGVFGPNLRP